jgi:hypothetical protein
MPDNTTATCYRGWWRRNKRSPWVCLCRAGTFDNCWRDLIHAIALRRGKGGDSAVLPDGSDPNVTAPGGGVRRG